MEHKQSRLLPLTSLAEDMGHPPACVKAIGLSEITGATPVSKREY